MSPSLHNRGSFLPLLPSSRGRSLGEKQILLGQGRGDRFSLDVGISASLLAISYWLLAISFVASLCRPLRRSVRLPRSLVSGIVPEVWSLKFGVSAAALFCLLFTLLPSQAAVYSVNSA